MKHLLSNYYIDFKAKKNTAWCILALLHELRIMSAKQLESLINIEFPISYRAINKNLKKMVESELIGFIEDKGNNNQHYYYLTRKGNSNFGGIYPYPKNPEYNLQHHLLLTDFLTIGLKEARGQEHFSIVSSERRQVFEIKDGSNQQGRIYTVSDFLFRFIGEYEQEINWYFEIELTLKSRQRYMQTIFPKYYTLLRENEEFHVFYVTPSEYIKNQLDNFKEFYERKYDPDVFKRFHIMYDYEFQNKVRLLIESDRYINY